MYIFTLMKFWHMHSKPTEKNANVRQLKIWHKKTRAAIFQHRYTFASTKIKWYKSSERPYRIRRQDYGNSRFVHIQLRRWTSLKYDSYSQQDEEDLCNSRRWNKTQFIRAVNQINWNRRLHKTHHCSNWWWWCTALDVKFEPLSQR